MLFRSWLLILTISSSFTSLAQTPDPAAAAKMLHQDFWITQSGNKLNFSDLDHHWMIVTLAYTDCESACPMIVHQLKDLRKKIVASKIQKNPALHFVLLSLKPVSDTPEAMRKFMKHHGLKTSDWTFIRGTEEQARLLASHLDMSFGPLKGASRHIMHSSKVALISPDGKLQKVWLSSELTAEQLQESLATP
jgi:protein SCO1